jgi:putative Mg2+ transporter-C (MgtC) family protein
MTELVPFGEPSGQGWTQIIELATALVLCSLIGLERELKQKSAGLRTLTLVGLGAALFLLISKYGFTDVLVEGRTVLDPSRVAAQIVSGVGFIGGGLIFVRQNIVRGLTTAAVVWVSVAVGCACAAGLPLLAVFVTAAHFLVVYGYPPLVRLLTRSRPTTTVVRASYRDGEGALRDIIELVTTSGYVVEHASTNRNEASHVIDLRLRLTGPRQLAALVTGLSDQSGVLTVDTGEEESEE